MEKKIKRIIVVGLLVALAVSIGFFAYFVYSAITWTQDIDWDYQETNASFSISNPATVNYGTLIGPTTKTETYTISNNGNVPLSVSASTITTGSVTVSWNKETANIAVGGSTNFVLTLTITGAGSCLVTIQKT